MICLSFSIESKSFEDYNGSMEVLLVKFFNRFKHQEPISEGEKYYRMGLENPKRQINYFEEALIQGYKPVKVPLAKCYYEKSIWARKNDC